MIKMRVIIRNIIKTIFIIFDFFYYYFLFFYIESEFISGLKLIILIRIYKENIL